MGYVKIPKKRAGNIDSVLAPALKNTDAEKSVLVLKKKRYSISVFLSTDTDTKFYLVAPALQNRMRKIRKNEICQNTRQISVKFVV